MRTPEKERPRQLPFGFGRDSGHAPEDLVVTGANRAAVHLITAWPSWPSPVVVLAGPSGSGKTHLAAIWRARSGAVELDPGNLASPALVDGAAVLVEDADRAGIDDAALFHLINAVRAAGGSLLLTARSLPQAWGVRLQDLASRLKAATVAEIAAPDDALLSGVIVKLFADRQIEVEAHVVGFMIHRMDRSLASAMRVVDLIDRLSLERKSRITRALAAEALSLTGSRPVDAEP